MGERTQIFLQRVNKEGVVKNEFYHYQWGFGGTMYRALMNLILDMYDNHGYEKSWIDRDYDFFKLGKLYGYETTEYFKGIGEIKQEDLLTEAFIEELQSHGDNNDGYLVIQVVEGERGRFEKLAFGFVDNGYYGITGRYLTWQEYAKKHGYQYVSDSFKEMFKGFLAWSEIAELKIEKKEE